MVRPNTPRTRKMGSNIPNTKFNLVVNQVREAVASANGWSMSSGNLGGDAELVNSMSAKALIALTQQIVKHTLQPRGPVVQVA